MTTLVLAINDKIGLHARTAKEFAAVAGRFKCNIQAVFGAKSVNAKSMLKLMTLGVKKGAEIKVQAEGEDADEAISSLRLLVENVFNKSQSYPDE